jgi:hypothetical protein
MTDWHVNFTFPSPYVDPELGIKAHSQEPGSGDIFRVGQKIDITWKLDPKLEWALSLALYQLVDGEIKDGAPDVFSKFRREL